MPRVEQRIPRLLVSVRACAEAESALRGGAGLIDVKEPSRGPLGRADDTVIRQVAQFVAGRRPVSAALGELIDQRGPLPDAPLAFVKWGLSRCADRLDWRGRLAEIIQSRRHAGPCVVVTAYADWQDAQSPPVADVVEFACRWPGCVFMIDTFGKQLDTVRGRRLHLLDWLSPTYIHDLCRRCRDADVKVALAGSLDREVMARLAGMCPDWFAVRGAVCVTGERESAVDEALVRALADGPFNQPKQAGCFEQPGC